MLHCTDPNATLNTPKAFSGFRRLHACTQWTVDWDAGLLSHQLRCLWSFLIEPRTIRVGPC